MPALGDPVAAETRESKSAHGQLQPRSYVPLPQPPKHKGAPAVALGKTRAGGRRPEETRKCLMRASGVPNATGSGYVEQGGTKVMATVYGPRTTGRDSAEGFLYFDMAFAPFCSRRSSKEDNEKRAHLYSSMLQGALESLVLLDRYGKLALDVSVYVLEDDGALLTTALAAASLALADAKIEMRDLAAGATVHLVASPSAPSRAPVLLLDCDGEEEWSMPVGSTVVHLGVCPSSGSVCLMHSVGPLPGGPFEQMMLLAKDTAEALGAEMRRCLDERGERRAAKRAKTAPKANDAMALDIVYNNAA